MDFKEKHRDVLIVGGGIIGLSLARELHQKKIGKITILERGQIGREASHAAAGMLAPHAETEKLDDFYQFCRQSITLYSTYARDLFEETGIDIELDKSGTLYLAFTEKDFEEITRRFRWQKSAGLEVERFSARETRQIEPFVSPDVLASLYYPTDWQVENRKLLQALQKYCEKFGIEIFENTEIKNLLIENGRVKGAETDREKFYGEQVALATGAWTSFIQAEDFTLPEVKPVRGQMISFQTAKRLFGKVIYSPRGYLVPRADGRILAGATVEDAGFDKSVTRSGIEILRERALEIAPSLINLNIVESWAGLRPMAPDGWPVMGELTGIENLFIATAHYRNGILLAPLTAQILAGKMAQNLESRYLEIFHPRRFHLRSKHGAVRL